MPANVVDDQFGSRMLVWGLDGIEANTIEQAQRTARLPFVERPGAAMFVEQGEPNQRHRRVVDGPEFRHVTERHQGNEHQDMKPLRES